MATSVVGNGPAYTVIWPTAEELDPAPPRPGLDALLAGRRAGPEDLQPPVYQLPWDPRPAWFAADITSLCVRKIQERPRSVHDVSNVDPWFRHDGAPDMDGSPAEI